MSPCLVDSLQLCGRKVIGYSTWQSLCYLDRMQCVCGLQTPSCWCARVPLQEFYREYLKKENAARRQLLYVMNPNKFQACQFLIQYHEQVCMGACHSGITSSRTAQLQQLSHPCTLKCIQAACCTLQLSTACSSGMLLAQCCWLTRKKVSFRTRHSPRVEACMRRRERFSRVFEGFFARVATGAR